MFFGVGGTTTLVQTWVSAVQITQPLDCLHRLASRSNRQAKLLQIVFREMGQRIGIDFRICEGLRIL